MCRTGKVCDLKMISYREWIQVNLTRLLYSGPKKSWPVCFHVFLMDGRVRTFVAHRIYHHFKIISRGIRIAVRAPHPTTLPGTWYHVSSSPGRTYPIFPEHNNKEWQGEWCWATMDSQNACEDTVERSTSAEAQEMKTSFLPCPHPSPQQANVSIHGPARYSNAFRKLGTGWRAK